MGLLEFIKSILCNQDELDDARVMIAILQDEVNELQLDRDTLYDLSDSDPDRDVLDYKYVGEMSPEELIEQYEHRAGVHLSYLAKLKDEPAYRDYWLQWGDEDHHIWAINGYEKGIEIFELLRV